MWLPEQTQHNSPGHIPSTSVQASIVFKETAIIAAMGNIDRGIIISLDRSFRFCGMAKIVSVEIMRPTKAVTNKHGLCYKLFLTHLLNLAILL